MAANTSEHTAIKQAGFREWIRLHINIVKQVWNKNPYYKPVYLYLDLYAGPGYYNDQFYQGPGSPIIAIDELRKALVGYQCHLFNNDDIEIQQLRASLDGNKKAIVHWGDNQHEFNKLMTNHNIFGLAYLDPNNVLPDFEVAKMVRDKFNKLDILFYFGATADKRVRRRFNRPIGEGYSLLERMKFLEKNKWIVKEPNSKWQYTFLLATNGDIGDWKRRGWYDVESSMGWEILSRLNYTDTELLYSDQMRLI